MFNEKTAFNENIKTVKIICYSGTGGTARVGECFTKIFRERGCLVNLHHLKAGKITEENDYNLLLVVFAVHACNAPESIYKWIDSTKKVNGIPAAVISVSGGGEVSPNTACRLSTARKLKKKGYNVNYEKMLIMPSNWIVPTKGPLALKLLEVFPKKVERIVDDLLSGVKCKVTPLLIDRAFSLFGELEKFGAHSIGKRIKVSNKCNGCGWCALNCPAGNITLNQSKPQFSNKCHICLKCIYGCSQKALKLGAFNFVVIKEGYNLTELEKKLPCSEQVDIENLTKGYLWSGVRKYLMEE